MNGQMGTYYTKALINYDSPAILYSREGDIKKPVPSDAYVFCEESPYTINDGYMEINSQTTMPAFPDVPAAYLDNGCAFSFADGHAEAHKWVTSVVLNAKGSINSIPGGGQNNADWVWFTQHAASNP